MSHMNNTLDWVAQVSGNASHRAISDRINVSNSTVSRWLDPKDSKLTADGIVGIAHAYGANPIEGLVLAGVVTQANVDDASIKTGIQSAPIEVLMIELAERAKKVNQALVKLGIKGGLDGLE